MEGYREVAHQRAEALTAVKAAWATAHGESAADEDDDDLDPNDLLEPDPASRHPALGRNIPYRPQRHSYSTALRSSGGLTNVPSPWVTVTQPVSRSTFTAARTVSLE